MSKGRYIKKEDGSIRWQPYKNQTYTTIRIELGSEKLIPVEHRFIGDRTDLGKTAIGFCFKSKAQAERLIPKLQALLNEFMLSEYNQENNKV